MHRRSMRPGHLAILVAAVFAAVGAGAEDTRWHVAHADLHVLCPLTVGGSFEAKTSALDGTLALTALSPAVLSGELTVDLGTLDTGIGLRNEHMKSEYLGIGKGDGYDQAVLSQIQLRDVASAGFQGRTGFSATLRLHGTTREVSGQSEIRRDGTSLRIEATFPVTLADYGIPKPQYLGVGVKSEVQVKVNMAVSMQAAVANASR